MEYRTAVLADLPEIVALRLAFLEEDSGGLAPAERQSLSNVLPAYFRRHLGRDLTVYGAWEDGTMVSTAYLLAEELPANPRYPTGRRGSILNVYTVPAHRRRGLAAHLVNMAVDGGRALGLDRLELQATAQGAPVYRAAGFTPTPARLLAMEYRL